MLEMIIQIIGAILGVICFIATTVWAVAQIKETTSSLSIEIKHLREKIGEIVDDYKDHETRIRRMERSRHQCDLED